MASDVETSISGTADRATNAFVETIANEVLDALPEHFRDGLLPNDRLNIRIERLNEILDGRDFCSNDDKTFGLFDRKNNRIVISQSLATLAYDNQLSDSDDFDCNHRSYVETLRATIAHELAHVFDKQHRVSADEQFGKLTGGETTYHPLRANKVRNFNVASSPDAYEFKNLRESFAVNFEYYLIDPSYRCARPAFAHYFDGLFGIDQRPSCAAYSDVLLHSHIQSDNLNRTASLSPNNVYQVHYLLASKGSSVASKWGHGMFRLVTCAPERELPGPECLQDTPYHLVLSYRANVADVTINYAKGLFGSYPSQLFIYELPDIINEYSRVEFRDLVSVPLELSEDDLQQFLNVALERYWNYQGKYFFVSNHCGTEALNHLAATDVDLADGLSSRTPSRLLKSLRNSDLVESATYKAILASDSPSAYFFPSKEPLYQDAFEAAQRNGLFGDESFKSYVVNSTGADRIQEYDSLFASRDFLDATLSEKRSILTNALLLERLMKSNEQKRLASDIVRTLMDDDSVLLDSIRGRIELLYDEPWDLVDDDYYGIPNRAAIHNFISRADDRTVFGTEVTALMSEHVPLKPYLSQLENLATLERRLTKELVRLSM